MEINCLALTEVRFNGLNHRTLVELSKPHAEGMNQAYDAFRFNSGSNRTIRPYTDVTWPTISPVSSDVQVKITQEEIIEEISPQQLELLQILLEETRQTKEVLNSINLNDQYAFTYSPDFGIAQVPNPGNGFGVALLDNDSKFQMSKAVTDSRFDVDLFERQLNEYIRTRKNTDRQKLINTASKFSKYSDDVIKYARKYLLNDKTVISGLRLSAVGAFGTVLTAMPQAALNEGMRFARATVPVGNALPDELAAKLTSKLKTQECKNLSNPNVKMNVINAIGENRNALADLAEMANKLNSYAKQNNHTEVQKALLTLEKAVPQALINIYAAANKLTQECDECENVDSNKGKNVSEPKLICRVCKMNTKQQDSLEKTAKIRRTLLNENGGFYSPSDLKSRSIAYAFLPLPERLQHFAAYSGSDLIQSISDNDLVKAIGNQIQSLTIKPNFLLIGHEYQYLKSRNYLSPKESSQIFSSLKSSSTNGTFIHNDAEIKIMETAENLLRNPRINKNTVELLYIFSDRLTCAYCQEVAFRAIQNRDYFLYPGHIFTPLDIRTDGGPYYEGENVDHEMVLRVLNKVPQKCGQ